MAHLVSIRHAFASWRCSPAALLTQFASLLGYHAYLKMRFLLPMRYGALALLATLTIAIAFFSFSLFADEERKGTSRKRGKKEA